ncbi:MAG: hypothetical protein NW223_13815, partial [Hyphomicrobiaceae bacterium]|nr:hypothetical protein [Hyphomicrobiaceae bacterium]
RIARGRWIMVAMELAATAKPEEPADVFISYSSADVAQAEALQTALTSPEAPAPPRPRDGILRRFFGGWMRG